MFGIFKLKIRMAIKNRTSRMVFGQSKSQVFSNRYFSETVCLFAVNKLTAKPTIKVTTAPTAFHQNQKISGTNSHK